MAQFHRFGFPKRLKSNLAATFKYSGRYQSKVPGVEMWGNGRLFSLKDRIKDESVGWSYKFGGGQGTNPAANASSRRLHIVALFTAKDSRDIPWAAPVKNDYNRRSEFYAEIRELLAKTIRLYKNAVAFLESRLLPFSKAWTSLNEKEKLDALFADAEDATPEFKKAFTETRFGRKILEFKPTLSFREMTGKDAESTVYKVHGYPATLVKDLVKAASLTKGSAERVVDYLKVLFPNLHKEAELEEEMGLTFDEDVDL